MDSSSYSITSPLISAVICHHKGDFIYDCVKSVLASRNVLVDVFVLTDKNLHDNGFKLIYSKAMPAQKRNIGIRYAHSRFVAFLDDDVEIDKDCLYEMYKECKESRIGMVYAKTYNAERRNIIDSGGSWLTWTGFLNAREHGDVEDIGQFQETIPVLAAKSACCMVNRKAFIDAGMFDASYGILGEETDLSWRMWLRGWTVLFTPKALAWHWFRTKKKSIDFYTIPRIYFNGCRNYLSMLFTNLSINKLIKTLPVHIFAWTLVAIFMFFSGRFSASKNILLGILSFIFNLRQHILKRRNVQTHRVISDKELFKSIYKDQPLRYYFSRLKSYILTGLHG